MMVIIVMLVVFTVNGGGGGDRAMVFVAVLVLIVMVAAVMVVGFPSGSDGKESDCNVETRVQSLGWEDPLEKGMATHSNILAWRIPWTEEPGGRQSMGSQRIQQDRATSTHSLTQW